MTRFISSLLLATLLGLVAWGCAPEDPGSGAETAADSDMGADVAASPPEVADGFSGLDQVLADPRRDEDRARDATRKPQQTIEFFQVEADHAVVEALPGGGWYTRILLPYVTPNGRYMAINYPVDVYEQIMGGRMTEQMRSRMQSWAETFADQALKTAPEGAEVAGAFHFGAVPDDAAGQADAVLLIRALHNMARTGRLSMAVEDVYRLLKPGGVAGVIQHRAKADAPDDYANGSKGYLKESTVIDAFLAAGFQLEARSEMHANPRDPANHEAGVWTLPPSLRLGDEDRDKFVAIGESDRMTLRFRKPS